MREPRVDVALTARPVPHVACRRPEVWAGSRKPNVTMVSSVEDGDCLRCATCGSLEPTMLIRGFKALKIECPPLNLTDRRTNDVPRMSSSTRALRPDDMSCK